MAELDANTELFDESVRRLVLLERFKTRAWRRVIGLLNREVFPDLYATLQRRLDRITVRGFDTGVFTTVRYRRMIEELDSIIQTGLAAARATSVSKDILPLMRREAAALVSEMEAAVGLGLGFRFSGVDTTALRSLIAARPFQGRLLREHYQKLTVDTRQLVRQQIRIGIAAGETTPQIVRRLRGTRAAGFTNGAMQTTRREATAITRTAINHFAAHAREAVYKENTDLVKGVRFVATLDNRTTFQCGSLDGQVFPVGEGERPPLHMPCRSTTTPVLRSWRELGIDINAAPPGTRASLSGRVPATETYQTWFRRQPRAVQRAILGPGRLRLFDEGRLTEIRELLGPTGQPLTLDQLFAKAS